MDTQEVWRWIKGYEGRYQVSDQGRIKSFLRYPEGKIIKPSGDGRGYLTINLRLNGEYKNHKIHRLVCEAFNPNPENKPEVNHKFGIKTDNRASELEWVTHQENMNHANILGLMNNRKGLDHQRIDKTIYTFNHPELGNYTGTRYEFYTHFKLNSARVHTLVKGDSLSVQGWRLMSH